MIQNRSAKDVKMKPGTEIGTVTMANIVPTTQVGDGFNMGEQERVSSMSAQVISNDLLGEISDLNDDPKDILHKVNLSRMEEWEPQLQQYAWDLICEFACIFSQNDLDLGKTSIINHSIQVNDPVLFKEWYRCIPPGIMMKLKCTSKKCWMWVLLELQIVPGLVPSF